jgi:hypothetical protein
MRDPPSPCSGPLSSYCAAVIVRQCDYNTVNVATLYMYMISDANSQTRVLIEDTDFRVYGSSSLNINGAGFADITVQRNTLTPHCQGASFTAYLSIAMATNGLFLFDNNTLTSLSTTDSLLRMSTSANGRFVVSNNRFVQNRIHPALITQYQADNPSSFQLQGNLFQDNIRVYTSPVPPVIDFN